ncbi:hypothetical protein AOCH_000700 [Aspergillus ochraceoroseus]|uniref:Ubiquitin-conjugating enzyme E2C-binding protein n=2 Tax=Aspergillus ochraceoroseus TaxID=138278 RepID=A0A0F8UMR6_9EURO|nr:hypothetical protein AOCH_000700 [Aspergillus ochraceoroseus]
MSISERMVWITMSAPPESQNGAAPLYLHAELLPNIRHVTLHISVPSKPQSTDILPDISLLQSRRAVSVALPEPFADVTDTIKLPARVTEASRRLLTARRQNARSTTTHVAAAAAAAAAPGPRQEFSFRMQIDENDESLRAAADHLDSFVPWTAADMSPATQLRCRRCENLILGMPWRPAPSTTQWTWKDLPSGNWAEMMDFWHCHKPDSREERAAAHGDGARQLTEDENSMIKGYGASNRVLATPGTVLVDVATFLVSDLDCRGLKKASNENVDDISSKTEEELACENCNASVAVEDPVAKGRRLFKTSLSAGFPSTESNPEVISWESHPVELIVAAQLLELIERESARRFVIHSGRGDGILIWVFNPDMRYSNSCSDHSITSQRAMKVFFQSISNAEEVLHPEPGKASSLSLEELRLPLSDFTSLSDTLEASNAMLPLSARLFQEWRVGILHRFERSK